MATRTTKASASIIPSPILSFQSGLQPVTCQPLTVTWFYTGPDSPIDLIATNVGVPQDAPEPSLTSSTSRGPNTFSNGRRAVPTGASKPIPSVNVQFASDVDPTLLSYSWPSVNISEGWYLFTANMPAFQYSEDSAPIYVHQGDDTSCLASTTSSSTSIDVSSSTASSTTSSPSSSILVPIAGASHTGAGTIVGVSIGAIALIVMVLTAWLCLHRRTRATGVLGIGAGSNRWNGLSSVDSRMLTNNKPPPSGRHHQNRNASIGTIPPGEEDAVAAEKNSIYGKHNDVYNHFDGPGVALSALPVLQHQPPKAKVPSRTYSASSSTSNVFSPNEYSTAPGRRPSIPDSVIGRRSVDSTNAYPPHSPVSPHGKSANPYPPNVSLSPSTNTSLTHHQNSSQSTSSHTLQHQPQRISPSDSNSPVSPISSGRDAGKDAKRQSLGGKKRKPVPAYDPSQDPISPSLAPSPVPPPSPGPDHINQNEGHYATRNHSGKDANEHELAHKSSFGPGGLEGKPVHYLIPDMPMSLRD